MKHSDQNYPFGQLYVIISHPGNHAILLHFQRHSMVLNRFRLFRNRCNHHIIISNPCRNNRIKFVTWYSMQDQCYMAVVFHSTRFCMNVQDQCFFSFVENFHQDLYFEIEFSWKKSGNWTELLRFSKMIHLPFFLQNIRHFWLIVKEQDLSFLKETVVREMIYVW